MLKKLLHKNYKYWNHERSLKALLIYMILALFIWIDIDETQADWWGFLIRDLIFSLIVLAGVFTVFTRWKKQLVFIIIAILTSVLRILSFFIDSEFIQLTGYAVAIVFFVLLVRLVLKHILNKGPVNFYRIQGSVAVFIIIGIIYALIYSLVEAWLPHSFVFTEPVENSTLSFSQFLYFSFVTMTTLGYGDMIAMGPLSRSLVIFQGITGLLYPVIMIARLISMEVAHNTSHAKKS